MEEAVTRAAASFLLARPVLLRSLPRNTQAKRNTAKRNKYMEGVGRQSGSSHANEFQGFRPEEVTRIMGPL